MFDSRFRMRMRYTLASVSYSRYVPLFFLANPYNIQMSQAFRGVSADFGALEDMFESIERFLNRLDIYTRVPPTPAMTEIVVKIMVELLSTLALATKQIQQGKPSEFVFDDDFSGSMQYREICKEAFWREWCRGGSSETRPTYSGGGSDDGGADARGRLWTYPESEGGHRRQENIFSSSIPGC